MGFFSDSVRQNADKMMSQVGKKVEDIATELFTEVVLMSPANPTMAATQRTAKWAKGEFNNNWFAATNSETLSHTSVRSMTGRDSRASIRTLKNAKTFYKKNGYVTLTNTTSYSGNIEYDGWPSGLTPYAPVRKAFINIVPKYK